MFPIPERCLLQCSDRGRKLAERFMQQGAEGLKKEKPPVLDAVQKVLIWLIVEQMISGILQGKAYDLFLKCSQASRLLRCHRRR